MNEEFEIVVTTLLGVEAFVAREIKRLGYGNVKTEDGRVTFWGDMTAVARANMWIRTGERVLIKVGEFYAETFDELFENVKALEWERWLTRESAFPVKGYTLKSQLASERDCCSIIKKAIVDRLSQKYGIEWFEESGALYKVQFSLMKNKAVLMIDTSGDSLHKRGYRQISNAAPLRETIAAAMTMLSYWKFEYPLADPFCGSGTIPIEAVMFKKNIAPGRMRSFAYESFYQADNLIKKNAVTEAEDSVRDIPLEIYASDIDGESVKIAEQNIEKAGLSNYIAPRILDAVDFKCNKPCGTIITNPPYGERMGSREECEKLYGRFGEMFGGLEDWSCYILTSDANFETHFGRNAAKKRKIYNGMIKCNIYQYFKNIKRNQKRTLKND